MGPYNINLPDHIKANVEYWLNLAKENRSSGDRNLISLDVEERNLAKAFEIGITVPQSFDLSVDLLTQISLLHAFGSRISEWINLISLAIRIIPPGKEKRLCVLYNQLAHLHTMRNHPNRAHYYYYLGLHNAALYGNFRELRIAQLGTARHYLQTNEYKLAFEITESLINDDKEKEDILIILAAAWNMLATISIHQGRYRIAQRHYRYAKNLYLGRNKNSQYGASLGNLAIIYFQDENMMRCLQYLARSRRIFVKWNMETQLIKIDYLFGLTFMKLEMWDKAQHSFVRSISSTLQKFPDALMLSHLYECLGVSCFKISKVDLGIYYLKKSLRISLELAHKHLP